MEIQHLGKWIIIFGIFLIVIGVLIALAPKIPYIGRLPGDIYIRRNSLTIYFPIVSSILVSIALTLILNLILRRK
jgi:hypothetical protein